MHIVHHNKQAVTSSKLHRWRSERFRRINAGKMNQGIVSDHLQTRSRPVAAAADAAVVVAAALDKGLAKSTLTCFQMNAGVT